LRSVSQWTGGRGREQEVGLLTGLFSKWLQFFGEGLDFLLGKSDEVVKNYY
jgi:hypothetical protein